MERRLRRAVTGVGLGCYFVWLLAVVVLVVTQLTPGPVPAAVDWVVTIGAGIGFLVGLGRIIVRTPQYVKNVGRWLS